MSLFPGRSITISGSDPRQTSEPRQTGTTVQRRKRPVVEDLVLVSMAAVRFRVLLVFAFPRVASLADALLAQGGTDGSPSPGEGAWLPQEGECADASAFGPPSLDGPHLDRLFDRYSELANMVAGRMNQDLASVFRFVGQSTPMLLDSTQISDQAAGMHAAQSFWIVAPCAEDAAFCVLISVDCQDESVLRFLGAAGAAALGDRSDEDPTAGGLELL